MLSSFMDDRLSAHIKGLIVERAAAHEDVVIRDLFERFVPHEQRTARLGSVVQPEQILSIVGDSERGQRLFFDAQGVTCRNCHQIRGRGERLGPDLSEIGKKYGRDHILESILEPSKKIDPEFVPYVIETKDGRVHTGLLVNRNDDEVFLRDANRKEIRIAAGDVELLAPQRTSLMPELLLRDMTPQQTADLLAYLGSLRAQTSADTAGSR